MDIGSGKSAMVLEDMRGTKGYIDVQICTFGVNVYLQMPQPAYGTIDSPMYISIHLGII